MIMLLTHCFLFKISTRESSFLQWPISLALSVLEVMVGVLIRRDLLSFTVREMKAVLKLWLAKDTVSLEPKSLGHQAKSIKCT